MKEWRERSLRRRDVRQGGGGDDSERRIPGKKGNKTQWCGGKVGRPHGALVEEDYGWGGRKLGTRYRCERCKKVLRTVYLPRYMIRRNDSTP